MTFTTPEARQLQARLRDLDSSCPREPEFLHLLSHIRRDARMAVKQVEACSKFVWADEPEYRKLIGDTRQRLAGHAARLAVLWPGALLRLDDRPVNFMVRLLPPNNRGDWEGGVGVA